MPNIVRRLFRLLQVLGLTALCSIAAAAIVALWHHIIDTPQPLESSLPGETRIFRWKRGHIFYKVLGTIDAPPLVLLHTPGVSASAYEMRKIMQPLAEHYHVYAPDLLGFGLSDRPHGDYSAETYITLSQDFLAEVVKEPATLLASGLSCNYAVAVAVRSPQLCTHLVLISPTALFAAGQERKQGGLLTKLVALVRTPVVGLLLYPLVSARPALRYAIKRRHSDYTISELDYLYATTHQLGAQHAPLALIAGKLAHDASHQMDTLQQPTLIIWGTQALNDTRAIPSQLPTSTQIVLLQGSYVHEERPEAVVANIREWSKEGKVAIAVASTPTVETSEAVVNSASATVGEVVDIASTPAIETSEAAIVSISAAEENHIAVVDEHEVEAYCVKCKKKVAMQDPHEVTMKNGRPALRGTCPVCGTGLYRLTSSPRLKPGDSQPRG